MHTTYGARDLWAKTNLSSGPVVNSVVLPVASHGVRLLRLWPMAPAPPPPPPPPSPAQKCPHDFTPHAHGFWHNTDPCPGSDFHNCTEDHVNGTMLLCAAKCRSTPDCVAFEVNLPSKAGGACYIFLHTLAPPFTPVPGCFACVRKRANHEVAVAIALKLDDGVSVQPAWVGA